MRLAKIVFEFQRLLEAVFGARKISHCPILPTLVKKARGSSAILVRGAGRCAIHALRCFSMPQFRQKISHHARGIPLHVQDRRIGEAE
jgi:hypothetical protein